MAFVPEGQADSSQARSAWSHEKNSPVPAGRLKGSRLRLACVFRRNMHPGGPEPSGGCQAAARRLPDSLDPYQ
jgi:hypothetical protein